MVWRGANANANGANATLLFGSLLSVALYLVHGAWHHWRFHFCYATLLLVAADTASIDWVRRCSRPQADQRRRVVGVQRGGAAR